jgi:hypothetical protein
MVSDFGLNTLPARLQLAGINTAQVPKLDQQLRMF